MELIVYFFSLRRLWLVCFLLTSAHNLLVCFAVVDRVLRSVEESCSRVRVMAFLCI